MTEPKQKTPILKFGINLPAKEVVFDYDEGVTIAEHEAVRKDGTKFNSKVQYYYTVTYKGVKHGIYANSYLNNRLLEIKPKGKTIRIEKVQGETDKYPSWVVQEVAKVQQATPVGTEQQKRDPF